MQELSQWFFGGDMRWALLLIPLALGVFFSFFRNYSAGYIKKVYARMAQDSAKFRLRGVLPGFFAILGLLVVVAALMDFTRGYAEVEEHQTVNRIFVAIDNSSSMYDFKYQLESIYCADRNLREAYPRIYGACAALHRIVNETEAHAKRAGGTGKDHIALVRFALNSYLQFPLSSDYARFRRVIEEFNWREQLIRSASSTGAQKDIYTEIHLALWDLYRLALERNRAPNSGFAHLSLEDMKILARALEPETGNQPFSLPSRFKDTRGGDGALLPGFASRLKEELRDTVFIFITDANEGQLEQRVDSPPVSLRKMLEFAGLIELPVYFVSTDEANDIYKRMARKTGFLLGGKDYRGDFFVANRDLGYAHLETLVGNILQVRFGRTITVRTDRRISYAAPLSFIALTCFVLAVFFRETTSRSLTNV